MENKIIKKRFRCSIKRGTGEAHLIMKDHPSIDFSSDIIKASLTNYAYDGQSEESRAFYLFELIELSEQKEKILESVLHGLANERDDTWSLVQLFDIATFFAKQGYKKARQAIYKRFLKKIINGSDWCGYDSILKLDGFDGLIYIATTIGKYLEKHPEYWQDGMIIDHFQEDNQDINVIDELEKKCIENPHIKIYLDEVRRTENYREECQRDNKNQKQIFNIDTLRERIKHSPRIYIPPVFTKSLNDNEIKILADELLIEKDKMIIGKYLSVFSRIKFPYDYHILLKFAHTKANSENRIVEMAFEALKFFSGDDIRQLALDKLEKSTIPDRYSNLLISNFKPGDGELLTKIVNKFQSEDIIHNLVFSYVDIFKANKTKECKEPLEALYGKLTCGIHRSEIVKILMDNDVLSEKIKKEIRFDSNKETRELFEK